MAQQVRSRTDHRDQRHHQFLADRIDRRVGDLGEILLEVVVEQLGPGREHRERRVGAHRAHRIVALARHRLQEELQVFLRVAERLLMAQQGLQVVRPRQRAAFAAVRQLLQLELRGLQPIGVRVRVGQRALDLRVVDDAALFQVDQQHLARLQPPLADDLFLRHRQHAGLGGHDHVVVVGDEVARRAQPVAVQRGADLPPVGEGDRGRPVPRFHHARRSIRRTRAASAPSACCRPRPPGSAASSRAPASSRRRPGSPARCRCRRCRTGRAE